MRGAKTGGSPPRRSRPGKYMEDYPEVAREQLELRSTSRRAVSWKRVNLLGSPDPAGVGVGRSRFVSRQLVQIRRLF